MNINNRTYYINCIIVYNSPLLYTTSYNDCTVHQMIRLLKKIHEMWMKRQIILYEKKEIKYAMSLNNVISGKYRILRPYSVDDNGKRILLMHLITYDNSFIRDNLKNELLVMICEKYSHEPHILKQFLLKAIIEYVCVKI